MKAILSLLIIAVIGGCSGNPETKKTSEKPVDLKPFSGILITDKFGVPISDVKVLIGSKSGVPFANNIVTSSPSGEIDVPQEWTTAESVTLKHPGYVTTTYINMNPGPQNFRMRAKERNSSLMIQGKVKKYKGLSQDGLIDVGIVMPAIRLSDIMNFAINDYISPNSDTVTVFGQNLDIPSNVSLPDQYEWYGFLRIRLKKPNYSISVPGLGVHTLATLQARFKLSDMVREARKSNLDPFTLLNLVEFKNGTTKNIIFNSGTVYKSDLEPQGTNFNSTIQVEQSAVDPADMILGIHLVKSGFKYYPSDVKLVSPSGPTNLKYDGDPRGKVVFIQRAKDTNTKGPGIDRLSGKILPNNSTSNSTMLSIAAPPIAHTDLVRSDIPSHQNLAEVGSVAILSELELVDTGSVEYERKNKLWEVYNGSWEGEFKLPDWPDAEPRQAGSSYRWEVIYLANEQAPTQNNLGPQIFDTSSDFSKNAVDFVH